MSLRATLTQHGPDGVWTIPADATELTADMFKATTTPPTLAEMQAAVDGYIELVRIEGVGLGWVNEEGKLEGQPPNAIATVICRAARAIYLGDFIAGTFLLTIGKAEPD